MNGVKKQYRFAGTLAFIIDSDSLPIEKVFRFRMELVYCRKQVGKKNFLFSRCIPPYSECYFNI